MKVQPSKNVSDNFTDFSYWRVPLSDFVPEPNEPVQDTCLDVLYPMLKHKGDIFLEQVSYVTRKKPVEEPPVTLCHQFSFSTLLLLSDEKAIGHGKPLDDHWCDILDMILEVSPQKRLSILNRGSEFLTKKVLKYYPCLTEFLISLQNIQKSG